MKLFVHFDPETGELIVSRPAYNDQIYAGKSEAAILDITIPRCLEERQKRRSLAIPSGGFVEGTHYHIIEEEQRPVDGWFRWAWEWDDGFAIDMDKARTVQMDKIRAVRNAELAAKDITFMRAVEAGDASAQSTIGTAKQVLRDLPATFDITTDVDTPEKLKAKWPTELPARE
jgi:hypothetical protein